MDVALTSSIVNTATSLASAKTSDVLNMVVLKKALDMQAVSAATMIDAMQQSMPQPQLATSGTHWGPTSTPSPKFHGHGGGATLDHESYFTLKG